METDTSALGKALKGIKVLDLTHFEAGTTVTQALAWYGAEVIKIEAPEKGEAGRFASSKLPGVDSYYFIQLNCNKKSLTLNLRDERGKQLLRRMIPRADVFIENFGPGTIERLGFSYEQVSAINPRIIYAQAKGYGPGSPYASYLAFDRTAQPMGGSNAITGTADGPPLKPGPSMGDTGTGLGVLVGILAALIQRRTTGRGQRVEVAMQESVINNCRIAYAAEQVLGEVPSRQGVRRLLEDGTPCNVYPCEPFGPADYCCVHCPGDGEWQRLLGVIGRTDLAADPRFSTAGARKRNAEEVDRLIAEWMRRHTKREAMQLLAESGVPAGAVMDCWELMSDPHLRKRGTFAAIQHPKLGEVVVPGWPVKMSGSPIEVERNPLLGEHTDAVLAEWLGLKDPEIARLREEKVI